MVYISIVVQVRFFFVNCKHDSFAWVDCTPNGDGQLLPTKWTGLLHCIYWLTSAFILAASGFKSMPLCST